MSNSLRCGCGQPVHYAYVSVARRVAECSSCGSVLLPVHDAAHDPPRAIPRAFRGRGRFDMSAPAPAYRDAARPAGKRWTYSWFRWAGPFILVFGVPSVAFFGWLAFTFGGRETSPCVMTAFVVLALGYARVMYVVLAHTVNRSTIELGPVALRVQCGPLPLRFFPWSSVVIARSEIARFDVRRRVRERNDESFEVEVVDRDGNVSRLGGGMSAEEAIYLASELDDELRREELGD